MHGFVINIEDEARRNENFRIVLYTTNNSQLVLMRLLPGEEIGLETHEDTDQFFRVEAGNGVVIVNGITYEVSDGSAVVVPAGAEHNVINTGGEPLRLYTVYTPPHHADGTIHETKADADADTEHFDGTTTE